MILRIGNKQRIANRKTHRSTLCAEKGLTLIEVLAAVSILAIGIVGVLRAYAGSIATLEAGQFSINAVNLLKQKMTDVELATFEQEEMPRSGSGVVDDFHWEWNITSTSTEDLNELILTVSHKYNPRTFELNTYVVDKKEEEE